MREVHDGTSCAVAATSELIGSKWTALIVHDLSEGPRRFTELEHACPGISPRTLSERLHMLEGALGAGEEFTAALLTAFATLLTVKLDDVEAYLLAWIACELDAADADDLPDDQH